jgi:uncharacterized membrane protein YhaH (DUF805 family)
MDFAGAIKAGFKNYAKFRGRATRPEYWWFVLFAFLVSIVANVIDSLIGKESVGNLIALALFLPQLGLLFRRFRDAGVSPKWLFTYLIPLFVTFNVVVANADAFAALGTDFETYADDAQGLQNAIATGGYMETLIGPILVMVGVWLLWAAFEFVVTLLPSKKEPATPVAPETTA